MLKKKIVIMLCVCCMCCTCFSTRMFTVKAEEGILKNVSFADEDSNGSIDDWNYWYANTSQKADVSAPKGILTFQAEDGNVTLSQTIADVKGKQLQFHALMKTEGFTKGAGIIRYQLLNQSTSLQTIVVNKMQSNKDWMDVTQDMTIPETVDGKEVTALKLELIASSPTTGQVSFRNISLMEKTMVEEGLLKNPTYQDRDGDNKIDDWSYYDNKLIDHKESVEEGVLCVETNQAQLTLHQSVALRDDMKKKQYLFQGEVKTDQLTAGYATYRVQLVNAKNSSLASMETKIKLSGSNAWTFVEIPFDVPEIVKGEAVAGIKIEQIVTKSTGKAYFKNIWLKETGILEEEEHADPIDTLVYNGGYEKRNGAVPESWNVWQNTGTLAVTADSTIKKSGYYAVNLHNDEVAVNARGSIHQTITAIPDELQGQSVRLSQWVKTEGFQGKGLSVRLQYEAKNGSKPALSSQAVLVNQTQDWTEYSYIIDLPQETLKSIKLEYLYDEAQGNIWIDETRMTTYIRAQSIAVNPGMLTLAAGAVGNITTQITPANATMATISYRSFNEQVATVDTAGNVQAIQEGYTVMEAAQADGLKKEIAVLVSDSAIQVPEAQHITTLVNQRVDGQLDAAYRYEILAKAQHGTMLLQGTQYQYYPEKDYSGKDELTLLVVSADDKMGLLQIPIDVEAVDKQPEMADFILQLNENEQVVRQLTGHDPEMAELTYQLHDRAAHGEALIQEDMLTYTPDAGFSGYDALAIEVTDSYGNQITTSVTIYVAASQEKLLQNVKQEHPRLLVNQADFTRMQGYIKDDDIVKVWYEEIRGKADETLNKPVVPYQLPDGVRLDTLGSKYVVELAFMYKLSGEQKYFDRAWQELDSLCNQYPDWHPDHLLDTAMIANGVAIAYDWLYNDFTPQQREQVEIALYEKSLQEAKRQYDGNHRFVTDGFNWNFVCNSGFATSAFALAHHENSAYNELSGEIIQNAYRSIQYGLPQYAPQGDSVEGISYWDYGTRYLVSFLSCVSSATDKNEFINAPGIKETALYPIYMTGKAGTYNYSDNDMTEPVGYLNLWFAKAFHEPSYIWYQKYYIGNDITRVSLYDMLYYDPAYYGDTLAMALDRVYQSQAVTTMRSDFTDENTSFVGFKGGWNGAPHGDLDIGSFVYDMFQERWAVEFGKENYNLPGYWEINEGGQRWNYYRKNALGHNTLIIHPENGGNQKVGSYAGVVESRLNEANGGYSIVDMSDAYSSYGVDVKRGFAYFDRMQLLIRDEFTLKNEEDVYWQMHTKADIVLSEDLKQATLTQNGKQIMITLFDENGSDMQFATMDAKAYDGIDVAADQTANVGVQKLYIKTHTQKGTISVLISPVLGQRGSLSNIEVKPLDEWRTYDFSISIQNAWTTSLIMESYTYGEQATQPDAVSRLGTPIYTYSDAKAGVYTDTVPLVPGIWYVKAYVAGTDQYDALESEAVRFEIRKAVPEVISTPGEKVANMHDVLSTISLEAGWNWVTPDDQVVISGLYLARYAVDDRYYDYAEVEGYVRDGHYLEREVYVRVSEDIIAEEPQPNELPDTEILLPPIDKTNPAITTDKVVASQETKVAGDASQVPYVVTADATHLVVTGGICVLAGMVLLFLKRHRTYDR